MTLSQWLASVQGKAIDMDKEYGAQCWDLADSYCINVVGCPGLPTGNGSAAGVYTYFSAPLPNYFTRIANIPGNVGQVPAVGDMVVWSPNLPGSSGHGHIDVVLSVAPNKLSFVGEDENWNGAYAHEVTHDWRYILGWLHPKSQTASVTPTTGTAKVIRPCEVRVAPTTTAAVVKQPTASGTLQPGNTFAFKAIVNGQSVSENGVTSDQWFESTLGHYVWAGNVTKV